MKKWVISLCIVSLFLLTNLTSVQGLNIKADKQEKISNDNSSSIGKYTLLLLCQDERNQDFPYNHGINNTLVKVYYNGLLIRKKFTNKFGVVDFFCLPEGEYRIVSEKIHWSREEFFLNIPDDIPEIWVMPKIIWHEWKPNKPVMNCINTLFENLQILRRFL